MLTIAAVTGCSAVGGNNGASAASTHTAEPEAQVQKYAATIRILPYVDERNLGNPRKIGVGAENVSGFAALHGTDLVLEQDVASLVTDAMRKRLYKAGYRMVDPEEGNAMFEVSGVVKELTYNVKARDEVSLGVETTLRERATGKVLWSGLVTEKADRFAGVSGNSMNDVLRYLGWELGIVTQKTSDAITTLLAAQHPELFNVVAGTKPIPGVTVLTAPAAAPAAAAAPVAVPVAPAAYTPHASATKGLLVVTTDPPRAKIHVGGVYYGLSPLRLEMDPGIREVTARLAGYKNAREKVSIRKGDATEVELKLER